MYKYGSLCIFQIYGSAALNKNVSTISYQIPFSGKPVFVANSMIGEHVVSEFNDDQDKVRISLNSDIDQTAWLNGICICAF